MGNFGRHFLMISALLCAAALSACLPDQKDPTAVSDAGQLTGTFYASSLGNTAVQIQNAVLGNPSVFASAAATDLNLAAYGISQGSNGINFKSFICPLPLADGETVASKVAQITFLNGSDPATGKFNIKGIGTETGSMVAALNKRVASEQVGTYQSGTLIKLSNGADFSIPPSCAGFSIPPGAPVIVFNIDRPAVPVAAVSRTEYRTVECPVDISGRKQLGTTVQSRIVTYAPDGTITPSDPNAGWGGSSMEHCVSAVDVTTENRQTNTAGAASDLDSFASMTLRDLLMQQLAMDCSKITVKSSKLYGQSREQKTKLIDTCRKVAGSGTTVLQETNAGDAKDYRTINCAGGATSFQENVMGVNATINADPWTGSGTVSRLHENKNVNQNTVTSVNSQNQKWRGETLNCSRIEKVEISCSNINGIPNLADGVNKGLGRERFLDASFDSTISFESAQLNLDYFTGGSKLSDGTFTASRTATLTGWKDPDALQPNDQRVSSTWTVHNTGDCLWEKLELDPEAEYCPANYDSSKDGGWNIDEPIYSPEHSSPYTVYPRRNFGFNANYQETWGPRTDVFVTGHKHVGGVIPVGGSPYYAIEGAYNNLNQQLMPLVDLLATVNDGSIWAIHLGPGSDEYYKTNIAGYSFPYNNAPGLGSEPYLRSWGDGTTFSGTQTILFNKEGVHIAYRPAMVNGELRAVRSGYTREVKCGRTEKSIYSVSYPATWEGVNTTAVILDVTVREWKGTDVNGGSWSNPVRKYVAKIKHPMNSSYGFATVSYDPSSLPGTVSYGSPPPPPLPPIDAGACSMNGGIPFDADGDGIIDTCIMI